MQQQEYVISRFRDYFGCGQEIAPTQLKQLAAASAETVNNMARTAGNATAMHNTALLISAKGAATLENLWTNKTSSFGVDEIDILRVIVATDGSRPSYPINNGLPDTSLYEASEWKSHTDSRAQPLKNAINATGRINLMDTPVGTGFLITPNLVMTNRHVLQLLTHTDRTSFINPAFIDFKCENANTTVTRRHKIIKVVYAGAEEITSADHTKQDMALLEIQYTDELPEPIKICTQNNTSTGSDIFLIGFPNQRRSIPENSGMVYRNFFENMMGYKKVAPGKIIDGLLPYPGRFCHDASTLKGNSGSLIVASGNEQYAIGLHYGGTQGPPSENWAHTLDFFSKPNDPLRQIFDSYGVQYG